MTAGGRVVHLVLAGDVGPSGGTRYDERVARGLGGHGWSVARTDIPGPWPIGDDAARDGLARTIAAIPDGEVVLVDGLVACASPDIVEPASQRLRIAVLVHLPLPDETGLSAAAAADLADRERRTLRAVRSVVVTSRWAATRVREYGPEVQVDVAEPGVDPAPLAAGTMSRTGAAELLCVAAVTPRKDQANLVEALSRISRLRWRCSCVGPLDRAPDYAVAVEALVAERGLTDRVRLVGSREGGQLDAAYAAADLLVLVSRTETFGMVITEALSRGIPVLTASGDAAAATLGAAPDGTVPGLLVPPRDPSSLAAALESWLVDESLRARLRAAAVARRDTLGTWMQTTATLAAVLDRVSRQRVTS